MLLRTLVPPNTFRKDVQVWQRFCSPILELDKTCRARPPEGKVINHRFEEDWVRVRDVILIIITFLRCARFSVTRLSFWNLFWAIKMELSKGFHSKRRPKTGPDGHGRTDGRTDKHTSIFWRLLHNKLFGQLGYDCCEYHSFLSTFGKGGNGNGGNGIQSQMNSGNGVWKKLPPFEQHFLLIFSIRRSLGNGGNGNGGNGNGFGTNGGNSRRSRY